MRKLFTFIASVAFASSAAAQTVVSARAGTVDAPYTFAEVLHTTADGTVAGGGYIAAGDPREATDGYAGAGTTFTLGGVKVIAVGFVSQSSDTSVTGSQTSVVPWLLATRQFGRIVGTANYFSYTPVGDGEVVQVLEHAKTEYAFRGGRWLAGGGYAGTKIGDAAWEDRPFVTVTRRTPIGAFEVWLQRVREGERTVQVRYRRSF